MANTELDLFGTMGQVFKIGKFLFKGAMAAGYYLDR